MVIDSMSYPKYDSYKNSGVEWLGKIPSDWQLGRISAFFSERRQKVSDKDYPALSVTKLGVFPQWENVAKSNDGDNRKLVKKGDFVINSRSDRKGSSGIAKQDGSVSLINIVLKPVDIEPRYSEYLFKSYNFIEEFYRVGHGIVADLWTTRFDDIKNSIIALPTFDEQTKIANFLDQKTTQIDQAIALKQQQIEKLNEYKQIVIQNAVTKGLNPNAPMKDSGVAWIGNIPEHWEVISLRYLFNFLNYRRIPISAELRGNIQGIYPYYGASGIIDYIDKYIFDEKLILIAEDGANLLSKSTPLAFIAEGKYWVNNHAHILKPKHEGFEYWAELLSCCDYTKYISGSAQPKLSRENLGSVRLVLPYREEILEISKLINQIKPRYDDAISKHEAQIDRLKEYKNILINQAVTGKIKI